MRWYREELGTGWEWELTRLQITRDGEQVGVLVEGSADRDNVSLGFWNDGLAYGTDDPNAGSETSYEIVVWNRPRGVSY
jgi:hypothetical protein